MSNPLVDGMLRRYPPILGGRHSVWGHAADLYSEAKTACIEDGAAKVRAEANRIFFWVLLAQWVFAIALALILAPYGWTGGTRSLHFYVQLAVFGGAALNALPIALIYLHILSKREATLDVAKQDIEQQVTERTQDLERSREMFRLMAESTKAAPFTLDLTRGCFPYVGGQAIAGLGFTEDEWKQAGALDVIFPREHNSDLRTRLDECETGSFEFVATVLRNDAVRSEMRWSGTCELLSGTKSLRGLMQDITELRRLGRELTAAQKLESVGRLAAGVAHEINTPVQFVSDNVQFARASMTDIAAVILAYRALQEAAQQGGNVLEAAARAAQAETAAELDYLMKDVPLALEGAVEGLGRIATIVRSMKEFAHPDQADKTLADLNQAIRSTLVIARNEYKYVAEIDTQFGELPLVPCHLGEINQVVLNLIINAAHAISDVIKGTGSLGKLIVSTRFDADTDAVEVAIADSGSGIPESARNRVFDPFFTTKEVGKGTGQGLAIARSVIVNKHGGTLRFETECGKGTTFFIRLPLNTINSAETSVAA
jgi:signal transduction histidine kinase